MRAIIADTGPLYPAIDVDDQYHQRSKTQIQRINAENLTILLSFPVYLETYNLLLYRLGTEQAISFAKDCIGSVYFINPSQDQYIAATEKAARFSDQKITICDAVTAILSEEMNLPVWTYDYHFDVMQVQIWR